MHSFACKAESRLMEHSFHRQAHTITESVIKLNCLSDCYKKILKRHSYFSALTSLAFALIELRIKTRRSVILLVVIRSVFRCFTLTVESTKWTLPRHYKRNGVFWIYGDSLAVRLQASVRNRKLCRKLYRGCFRSYNWIYPVYNEWMNKVEDDDLDFDPQKVIIKVLEVLDHPFMQTENSVLLLNLGLHFPIGINFTTYRELIDDLVRILKETEVDSRGIRAPLYKAKVIWKTSTAIHKENAPSKNTTNWRFFTTQVCSPNSLNLFLR